jgi:hypothetical protein
MPRPALIGHPVRVVLAAGAIAVAGASIGVTRAQQAPPGQGQTARPLVPAAASSVALNPDAFYGQNVSVMGAVEQLLSKTAFSLDQDRTKNTGREVLVVAPYLNGVLPANAYVTVQGEVVKFDPALVAQRLKGYTLDLSPEAVARFQGRPAILATSVITAELADIGKRVPPPLTPAEEAFDKVMKQVSAANTALRPALDGSSADGTKEQTAILKKMFAEAQAFFKTRGLADAVEWAGTALKHVEAVEQAAAGGKWDEARTSSGNLAQMCQTCHAAHRERMEDGTFRIRGSQ